LVDAVAGKKQQVGTVGCNTPKDDLVECYSQLVERLQERTGRDMTVDLHKQFIEFTERTLKSDVLDKDPRAPDLHAILATLADGQDVYELMGNIPDDKISEVLTWVMNVDIPEEG